MSSSTANLKLMSMNLTPFLSRGMELAKLRAQERFGLDGSQAVLGHKTTKAAEIYAKKSAALAREVVEELG